MKRFSRFIAYAKEYKGLFALNIGFNLIGVVLTLVGMASLIPLIDILFKTNQTDLLEFLQPNPHTGILELGKYCEYEMNAWFAEKISSADSFTEGKKEALFTICLFISTVFLLKNVFLYLAEFFLAPIRNGLIASLRNEVYQKMLRLPISFFSDERKGDLMSRMTSDVNQLEWGMVSLQKIIREPIQIVIFLIGLFAIDIKLTLITIVLLPATGLVVSIIGKGLKRTSVKAQGKIGHILAIVEESLSAVKVIKGFAVEKIFNQKFAEENARFFKLSNRQVRKRTASSPISESIGVAVFALVMWFGGNVVFDDGNGIGGATLIGFLVMMWGLLAPIKSLTASFNGMQVAFVSLERVEMILQADEKNEAEQEGRDISDIKSGITVENVRFKYDTEEVLKGISLNIEKGKTIALVGHSGSGKSTLADLIPRFHDVSDGAIKIDGIDIKELNIQSLRKLTGIVTQDSILFNDSIRNNLSLGEEGFTDEDFKSALDIANASEFVYELNDGIDTVIGEQGGKLSGGQRQRLCIARAVLKNPPLLILDEATSALDTASEKVVQDALEKIMENRTAIVIAHRLSTIKNADEIVVLDKGIVVEQGTHLDLFEQKGVYFKLCNLQNVN